MSDTAVQAQYRPSGNLDVASALSPYRGPWSAKLAAHLLAENKNLKEALALIEEAVALGRDEIRHLYTLGEVRLALGNEVGSVEAYHTVLDLDPEDPNAHLEIGLYHGRRGEGEKAEEHLVEALKQDPSNPRALYSYASLYYAADNLDTAEELLVRAVTVDANYSPALSALAHRARVEEGRVCVGERRFGVPGGAERELLATDPLSALRDHQLGRARLLGRRRQGGEIGQRLRQGCGGEDLLHGAGRGGAEGARTHG